jgi:cholesterol transport system auxiliary component
MRAAACIAVLALLCGCEALKSQVSDHPRKYSLAPLHGAVGNAPAAARGPEAAPTLLVSPPQAAAGFDSPHMMYLREGGRLEYFAYNEWIDTPGRMLAPLIVVAVESKGAFRAVVQTPSPASGEMRLDTEVLRLQQEFIDTPSKVRFGLRATLVDHATRRVIATREFNAVVPSASEDPQGGVAAARTAVQSVLEELALFCAEGARRRR